MTWIARDRFPDQQAEILDLYLRDWEFRSICHDYGVVVQQIERVTASNMSVSIDPRVEQFRELEQELAGEILDQLQSIFTNPTNL